MMDIASFLKKHGQKLKKGLGQNFLINEQVLQTIVETAAMTPDDHIVEIGPGIGILTAELLQHAKHVTAIEIDTDLIPLLNAYIRSNELSNQRISELTIVNASALDTSLPDTPYKIVANIPYHITSPLLKHAYIEAETKPTTMTLLIQKEVAENICATDNFGRLSILVRLFGEPTYITTVPADAFLPPPNVSSAVIHIQTYDTPIADQKTIDEVFRLTKIAFGQKRKMLRGTLGSLEGGKELLEKAGVDPTRRPQTLSMEEWLSLAKSLKNG